jgi:hypothetical protein
MPSASRPPESPDDLLVSGRMSLRRGRTVLTVIVIAAMSHYVFLVWPVVAQNWDVRALLILGYPSAFAAVVVLSFFHR